MHVKDSHDHVNHRLKLARCTIIQGQEANISFTDLFSPKIIPINSEVDLRHKSLCGLLIYNFPCKNGNYLIPIYQEDTAGDLGDKI